MKSKNITTIILEGADGVGKDTIAHEMWQRHDKHFRVYVRGELSDYVYAKKYNRAFISTQRGLPFIYVLLVCKSFELTKRIASRKYASDEELKKELTKVDDQDLFINAVHDFRKDYHVITIDTTTLSVNDTVNEIWTRVQQYSESLKIDDELNEYNKMYKRGCDRLGLKFYVRDNQPFIENNSIMADAQLHNGSYETFSDKTMPHNFIFSLGYDTFVENTGEYDFQYIIDSKLKVRPELLDYFVTIKSAGLSCITKETFSDKVFGMDYLKRIAKAKATVYCCRDLTYLKMITVRPYEAALSNQVLFVDQQSDCDCTILTQIHKDNKTLIQKLYVTPENIVEHYLSLTQDDYIKILQNQYTWYTALLQTIGDKYNVDLR